MRPRKTAQTIESDKLLSRRVLVNIKRDQTAATPRVVWLHEIPILEDLFGEGNVTHIDPDLLDEGFSGKPSADTLPYNKKQDPILPPSETQGLGFVFIGNKGAEYDRLAVVYGSHPTFAGPVVEHVYGRMQDGKFVDLLGQPELEDLPDAQLRGLLVGYGADAEQMKAATDRTKLLALAGELGVEIN